MEDELFSVKHQVVFAAGASRGIGKAIVSGFASRGAKVFVTGRNMESLQSIQQEVKDQGYAIEICQADISVSEDNQRSVDEIFERHGRIDTLINVAGVNRRMPTRDVTEEDYDYVVNINQKGPFILSQLVAEKMIQTGGGSQINIASLNTDKPLKHVTPYAMSKAAMGHMTRALSMEWAQYNIRVNALAPGFILTDLTYKLWSDPDMEKWGKANTPQNRLGQPEDMVGTALFLASQASAFMTGQTLYVDGGFTAGFPWPIPE